MKKSTLIIRILMGLMFFVFGLNGFLQFLPQPPMPEKAMAFMGGLMQAGYFFPVLKGTEILCGLLLLSGFFVPLALVVLSPIVIQIFLFHTVIAPDGFVMGLIIVILQAFLGYAYREKYAAILSAK